MSSHLIEKPAGMIVWGEPGVEHTAVEIIRADSGVEN